MFKNERIKRKGNKIEISDEPGHYEFEELKRLLENYLQKIGRLRKELGKYCYLYA